MNKQNIVPVIGIALLVFVFVSNVISTKSYDRGKTTEVVVTARPAAASARYLTEGEITAEMEKAAADLFGGFSDVSRSREDGRTVVTAAFLTNYVAGAAAYAAAGTEDAPELWDHLVENARGASEQWHDVFVRNQLDDVSVQVLVFDESMPTDPVICARDGVVLRDPVRGVDLYVHNYTRTAPEIPEADVHFYVLNLNTGVVHRPGCSYAQKISADHREELSCTRDELLERGWNLCDYCKP